MSGNETREDRLAAKLRENLRRRKVQARKANTPADTGDSAEDGPNTGPASGPDTGTDTGPQQAENEHALPNRPQDR